MVLSTIGYLRLCSLLLSATLGWLLVRWPHAFSTLFAGLKQASHPTLTEPAAPTLRQEPVRRVRLKRPHIFDDIPPVEWVRAQARMVP